MILYQFIYLFQEENEMDECCSSSSNIEARNLLDCRHPSPVSILEASFSTESCNSSDCTESNSIEGNRQHVLLFKFKLLLSMETLILPEFLPGSKQCSSVLAQELISSSSLWKFNSAEAADAELSDSAASTSIATVVARKHEVALTATCSVRSTMWELEYVKEILCNVELMFKDFALGRAREIINPHLFYQLENRKGRMENDGDESMLNRKVLFDGVSECLDLRCRRYVGGGCKTWAKGVTMVRRKEWLSEEVYKEMSEWRSMGDCMVDELVDKDMSSQYGRWLDFEVEAFELGVEIESQIFTSLVNEVVADIFLF